MRNPTEVIKLKGKALELLRADPKEPLSRIGEAMGLGRKVLTEYARNDLSFNAALASIREGTPGEMKDKLVMSEQAESNQLLREFAERDYESPLLHVGPGDEEEVCFHLTDMHAGRLTRSCNSHILSESLESTAHAIVQIIRNRKRDHPIRKFHIFSTGDWVQGEALERYLDIEDLEFGTPVQAVFIVNELTKFVEILLPEVESITFHCVPGNHGNVKPRPRSFTDNWDLIAYGMLHERFTNTDKVSVVSSPEYMIVDVGGWRFHLRHGDNINSYMGVPWYGIQRLALQWKQSIPNWDVLVMGHFHQLASLKPNKIPIMMSGTFVSDDPYILSRWGVDGDNTMWMWGVHPSRPLTFRYGIEVRR